MSTMEDNCVSADLRIVLGLDGKDSVTCFRSRELDGSFHTKKERSKVDDMSVGGLRVLELGDREEEDVLCGREEVRRCVSELYQC